MTWVESVRERARSTMRAAGRQGGPPPFTPNQRLAPAVAPVVVVDPKPTVDDGIPRAVRVAGAWAWRIVLFVAAAYLLFRVIGVLRIVLIPVVVAILLAALLEPVAAAMRRRGMNRSLAAALVLIGGLIVVFGGLSLIVQTFIAQFDDLSDQVGQGIDEVQTWLANSPLHISQSQVSDAIEQLQRQFMDNRDSLATGALSTATTIGEVATGVLLALFTLFFYLRDGESIWTFLCRLLPRGARVPVARAGHYSWHTLVSYVRATVLVALIDAVGIGIGLAVMGIPLALPLAALVFLGAFIPVIGATVSGAVAVLVALVTQGPISALIVLAIVIGVQQLEGHVLQPLIMGRAVALHPLAVILAIATGVVVGGIVGGLVAVPILAVGNTAVRYLADHPGGEPTPDREPPGTEPTDEDEDEEKAAGVPDVESSVDQPPARA
ncbi:AI-2E family transporter [Asanoa iriomotensis]|uniref:AI-2E family transporter n=1 Tax=Asanoa iriomotensis TaxID=234613 RepID=A0ABQ4BU96_9ACTN|nr:AI-2E family transporter [Asanoa iriomotensis]GIF54096.1 AI-2E family transporter [Asanoa iriomotensis]